MDSDKMSVASMSVKQVGRHNVERFVFLQAD